MPRERKYTDPAIAEQKQTLKMLSKRCKEEQIQAKKDLKKKNEEAKKNGQYLIPPRSKYAIDEIELGIRIFISTYLLSCCRCDALKSVRSR